ncbi:hypothetical protein Q5P01_005395 [Channa striata]|uniref:Uncharacterized protein n=1 Tax=Channa striata TaxID=64152 RepID=A0AA88T194_CHASR|nr:hypothetical protein Q5P01_005395 [Channa striata]
MPEQVREEAKARIRLRGGDPQSEPLVLSDSGLQFGQYRGQTFQWLLSNDVGYADVLASYAELFREMVTAVTSHCATEGSLPVQNQDQRPVGFGAHARKRHISLYETHTQSVLH